MYTKRVIGLDVVQIVQKWLSLFSKTILLHSLSPHCCSYFLYLRQSLYLTSGFWVPSMSWVPCEELKTKSPVTSSQNLYSTVVLTMWQSTVLPEHSLVYMLNITWDIQDIPDHNYLPNFLNSKVLQEQQGYLLQWGGTRLQCPGSRYARGLTWVLGGLSSRLIESRAS